MSAKIKKGDTVCTERYKLHSPAGRNSENGEQINRYVPNIPTSQCDTVVKRVSGDTLHVKNRSGAKQALPKYFFYSEADAGGCKYFAPECAHETNVSEIETKRTIGALKNDRESSIRTQADIEKERIAKEIREEMRPRKSTFGCGGEFENKQTADAAIAKAHRKIDLETERKIKELPSIEEETRRHLATIGQKDGVNVDDLGERIGKLGVHITGLKESDGGFEIEILDPAASCLFKKRVSAGQIAEHGLAYFVHRILNAVAATRYAGKHGVAIVDE